MGTLTDETKIREVLNQVPECLKEATIKQDELVTAIQKIAKIAKINPSDAEKEACKEKELMDKFKGANVHCAAFKKAFSDKLKLDVNNVEFCLDNAACESECPDSNRYLAKSIHDQDFKQLCKPEARKSIDCVYDSDKCSDAVGKIQKFLGNMPKDKKALTDACNAFAVLSILPFFLALVTA